MQSIYSTDFEKALQQMVFFYVPFALLFCLLRQARVDADADQHLPARWWSGSRSLFAAVGFVEYATKTIFLNPKLVAANDVHTYFTVNSVFFDPDIFGRFLALVMIVLAVAAAATTAAMPRAAGRRDASCSRSCGAASC